MLRQRPLIVAHRGSSFDAPENTLAAFRLAFEQNADAIEGDFRLTADGQVVCHHDATTGRCGDRNLTIGTSNWKDLRRVDVGRWKSPAFAGQVMPTLAEVLALVPRGRRILVELKTGPEIVPFLVPILRAGPVPLSRVLLMSFKPLTVLACKNVLPRVAANWLTDFKSQATDGGARMANAEILRTLRFCKADGIGVAAKPGMLTPSLLRQFTQGGYDWRVWTVDDIALSRFFARKGASAITTNRPALLVGQQLY